jgi:hypothetical protein
MFKQDITVARLGTAVVLASVAIVCMALPASAQFKQLPMEPLHENGQGVTPSFEGWWQNADGTYNLMFGYFNRNTKEALDVPVGPNNHIDPGGPDQGQPAHFVPRRQWGVFTVTVPKDFGDKKVTWTIVANGQTLSVPGHLGASWSITPMSEIGIGNTPPTISFDEKGPSIQGPRPLLVERTAKVGEPLSLTVFAADDDKSLFRPARGGAGAAAGGRGGRGGGRGGAAAAETPAPAGAAGAAPKPAADPTAELVAAAAAAGVDADTIAQFLNPNAVNLTWVQYRGPADGVKFGIEKPKMEPTPNSGIPVKNVFNGKATTTATFSQPGEYWLRLIVNDSSGPGGGGFLCCWTNGLVKVTVK